MSTFCLSTGGGVGADGSRAAASRFSDSTQETPQYMNAERNANFFSTLTFRWMTSLMMKGYKQPLEQADLPNLLPKYDAKYVSDTFDERLQKRRSQLSKETDRNVVEKSIKWEIIRSFFAIMWKDWIMSGLFEVRWSWVLMWLISPAYLNRIIFRFRNLGARY